MSAPQLGLLILTLCCVADVGLSVWIIRRARREIEALRAAPARP